MGYTGMLLMDGIFGSLTIGAVAGLRVGAVGGSTLSVIVLFGLTELGLIPAWFRIILLFAIGAITYVAFLQTQQGR